MEVLQIVLAAIVTMLALPNGRMWRTIWTRYSLD